MTASFDWDSIPDPPPAWTVKLRCGACGFLVIGADFARPCPTHGVPDLTKGISRGRVTCST